MQTLKTLLDFILHFPCRQHNLLMLVRMKLLGVGPVCNRAHLGDSRHDTFECKQLLLTSKQTRRFITVTLMIQPQHTEYHIRQ